MNIELYDFKRNDYYNGTTQPYMELKLVGVVDDFISCVFNRSYSGIGEWQIVIANGSPNVKRFRQARFIKLSDGVCGLIHQTATTISNEDDTTTFSGIELKGITELKLIDPYGDNSEQWGTKSNWSDKPAGRIMYYLIQYGLLTRGRTSRVPGELIASESYDTMGESTSLNITYDNLADTLTTLASTYGLGWYANIGVGESSRAGWDNTKPVIWWCPAYEGKDRTAAQTTNNRLVVSYSLDRVLNSSLEEVKYVPNYALVCGQGEGADRTRINYVKDSSKMGIDRMEVYVDARDLDDYLALNSRGEQKLAEYGTNMIYNCEASNALISSYKSGWDLGDIGTLVDSNLGISFDFRLNEITEVYEENQFRLQLSFGVDGNNLTSTLNQIQSNSTGLIKSESSGGGGGGGDTSDCVHITGAETVAGVKTFTDNPVIQNTTPDITMKIGTNNYGNITTSSSGSLTIQMRDNTSNSRTLTLKSPSGVSDAASALQLQNQVSGTTTTYNILHSGNILNYIYPVGSIYISNSSTFNPQNVFGGTWQRYAQGRVLIGAGTGTDSNGLSQTFSLGATGGEYTHTLTENEMPSHTHTQEQHRHNLGDTANTVGKGTNFDRPRNAGTGTDYYYTTYAQPVINATGGGQSHNNIQPYIGVYMWVRTN